MNDHTTKVPETATSRRANISLSAGFQISPVKSSTKQKPTATQKRRALKRRKPPEKPEA